jgi:hypothetical protein
MSLWSPLEAALDAWPVEHISRQRLIALADSLTPMVQLALQSGDPPDALAALLDPAFASALRALGISTLGPAYKLAPELTRAVSAEERKLQLVLKHLPPAAPARRVQIVTGYLKTRPAMPFLAALAQLHPGPLAEAERAYAALVNLDALSPAAAAIEPWRAEGQPDALIAALREVVAHHADIALLQRVALERGDAAQRLLGAALSGVRQDRDELPAILQLVAEHHADAPLVMLVAAELDPMATANVLALLLTEAKLQNPGDPEAEMTPARARMLCAARVLLPELGSPLSSVKDEDFTPIMRAGGLDALGVLPRWLAAWRQALTARP